MSKVAFFWARAVERFLQYLDFEGLAAELALQFTDPVLHLANLTIARHVIIAGDRDAPAFQH